MITEDYVSFETAKLLKEKGFDESTTMVYMSYGDLCKLNRYDSYCDLCKLNRYGYDSIRNSNYNDITKNYFEYTAPTLQMAMKWLREMYGLFVRITEDMTGNVFEWSVYQKNYGCKASTYVEDSYEQACEAAIKYCLENLI